MATDYELRVHRDWIGLLQPVGLVVSPPALLAAQAFPDKNILKEQQVLRALVTPPETKDGGKAAAAGPPLSLSFEALATQVLGWKPDKLVGGPNGAALPATIELVLPEFDETLRPTCAVPAFPEDGAEWMMLIQELANGTPLDEPPAEETRKWHASPQVRLERLLRETGVPIGILSNGRFIRLVYAPRGESSGHVTWPVHRLCTALDRDMLSALCMLLGTARLFALPREQRLPHILKESRKYQNVVSTKLADQVLEALNELLRGFQAANEASKGGLLDESVREDPDHVYGGLLAVLLRLVFILYAEERGLLSSSATYVRNYSLVGLFDELRIDAGRFPDTMDQRYGAWSRLLVLFRMVHDGAKRGEFRLPPRYGHLFDPDGWAFLEGRPYRSTRVMGAPVAVPKVADGVVLRVLEKLLLLDSDRLSYRALDVEQIGSVYENMMGFRLERAIETSIGVGKEHVVLGLETMLTKADADRAKHLKDTANVELSGKAAEALKQARTIDDLIASLGRRTSPLTPRPVPSGGLYLQPTDERRRSGSHYTPRELTEPIVRTTLRPILEDLGTNPKPEQILALKVCDPAMGSGAFLVEACRQLAEQLVKSYDLHGRPTDVPPDEDILLYAQRQVAQHCLYGVDKNPFAVDLAKLSLWLATLARDHAFTFLDYSIRQGDSLVGLSREQIASFNWSIEHGLKQQIPLLRAFVDRAIEEAMALRAKIPDLANSDDVREKRRLLRDADYALAKVRMVGDAVVACFFSEDGTKPREEVRRHWEARVQGSLSGIGAADDIRGFVEHWLSGERPVPCFHWGIEFPEVFGARGGFDTIVGNPPFAGGKIMPGVLGPVYCSFIKTITKEAKGAADLVAYFFRRAFTLLADGGCIGLLATNSLGQTVSRRVGIEPILRSGGHIYEVWRDRPWPGDAAVVVTRVHIRKGNATGCVLDGRRVEVIAATLSAGADVSKASRLVHDISYSAGVVLYGDSFILGTGDLARVLPDNPGLRRWLRPYVNGKILNETPCCESDLTIADFGEAEETVIEGCSHFLRWLKPQVLAERSGQTRQVHETRPWLHWDKRTEFFEQARKSAKVLVCATPSTYLSFRFTGSEKFFMQDVVVFSEERTGFFAVMQSRVHEIWARATAGTLKRDIRYSTSNAFVTFPLLPEVVDSPIVASAGVAYHTLRDEVMKRLGVGPTAVYTRFHDPEETDPDIVALRDLHAAMDRAVLDAYAWADIQPTCEFLLDYEEEEDDSQPARERRKKKHWRYRWPDDVRDEVLARLLELNAQRAKEQSNTPPSEDAPAIGEGRKKPSSRARGTKKAPPSSQGSLF